MLERLREIVHYRRNKEAAKNPIPFAGRPQTIKDIFYDEPPSDIYVNGLYRVTESAVVGIDTKEAIERREINKKTPPVAEDGAKT